MQNNRNLRILVLTVVAIIVVGLGANIAIAHNRKGAIVGITIGAPDAQDITAKIDGKDQPITKLSTKIPIKQGPHTLNISKAGYQDFSQEFTASNDHEVDIHAVLQRTSAPTLTSLSTVQPAKQAAGWQLVNATYFGNHDWALATAQQPPANDTFFVLRYDDIVGAWKVVSGPNDVLDATEITSYPRDMQEYMLQHKYAIEVL